MKEDISSRYKVMLNVQCLSPIVVVIPAGCNQSKKCICKLCPVYNNSFNTLYYRKAYFWNMSNIAKSKTSNNLVHFDRIKGYDHLWMTG